MWVSKKTRYALRMLIEVAKSGGQNISIKEISARENISAKYLEQIVIDLRRAKLVTATRGPKGGYKLVVSPQELTIKKLLDVFENGATMVQCSANPSYCSKSADCLSHKMWMLVEHRIAKVLDQITLADILKDKEVASGIAKISGQQAEQ